MKKVFKKMAWLLSALIMVSCTIEKHYNEWVEKGGSYYYYDESGLKVVGVGKVIGEGMYYFDNNGKMLTGWHKIDNNDMYFGSDGKMKVGWNNIDDKWYFFNDVGIMQTGWVEDSGNWYYCKNDGSMANNEWTNDGYYVDEKGIMRKGTGNGYTTSVTITERGDFNIDLNEVDYGSTVHFNFMRKFYDFDEVIIIEKIQPNGEILKENFNWPKNHNMFYTTYSSCNVSGKLQEKIYDNNHNLLVENSVIVKSNPNQKYANSNYNNSSIPLKERVKNSKFENEQIQLWLLKIIEDKELYPKSIWKNDILPAYEENLLSAIQLSITYANIGDDNFVKDVLQAKEFVKELGLDIYYKFR